MHNRTDPAWVTKCVDVSLKKAGLDYIDLYLIHDPTGGPDVRAAMWQGCCDVRDTGKVRAIGVRCVHRPLLRREGERERADEEGPARSNFGVKHLEDLLARKPKYAPAVNQVVRPLSLSLLLLPPSRTDLSSFSRRTCTRS